MNIAAIREKIRRIGFLIPVRIHFLLSVIALLLAYRWLLKNNAVPETAHTAIINLFIAVTFWFASGILVISFFSAFIPWVFFLFSKKNNRSILNVKTSAKSVSDKQLVEINISQILKPIFGYIRLRLRYDENSISPKFEPAKLKPKKKFFSLQTNGTYDWPLKNIKEYDINSGIIYFEDFFQFFSFTSQLSVNNNFYTQPLRAATGKVIVQPKKNRRYQYEN